MKEERVITLTGNPTIDLAILEHEIFRVRQEKVKDDYEKLNKAFEEYKKQIKAQ